MKKRVIKSVISSVAAVMVISSFIGTCLPMTAAEDIALTIETLTEDDSVEVFTNRKNDDSSELLYNYMLTQAGVTPEYDKTKNGKPVFYSAGITAGDKLTGTNALAYNYLKTQIQAIASGERTSTLIKIPASAFGIKEGPWSASELGVKSIVTNGKVSDQAITNLREKIDCDFDTVMTALLADCPYEMYWCDKTTYRFNTGGNMKVTEAGGEYCLTLTSFPVLELYVSADYAEDNDTGTTYMPDNRLAAVTDAINNAQAIVDRNRGKYGKELLDAYRKAICDAVEYTYDTDTNYGDPWQLIYVFDGDPSTNVVCEGYAKAFKYLCDISADRLENISCLIATGTSSAPHMWNIVNMDDDRSYLADITQCDSADRELPEFVDTFFLGIPVSGSFSTSYRFKFPGAKYYEGNYVYTYSSHTYDYTYDDDTKSTYNTAYLTLSTEPYTGPAGASPHEDNTDYTLALSVSNKTYDGKNVSPNTYIYKIGDNSKTAVLIPGADISCTYYKYDGKSNITEDYVNSLTALNGAPKDAGTYIVKASASAEGYVFEDIYSLFTIRRKTVNVTPAVSSKTFGDSDPDFSVISYSRSAIVKGDTVNITGAYGLDSNYNTEADVGVYGLTIGNLKTDNNNYVLAINGTFEVTPRTISNENVTVISRCIADAAGWAYPNEVIQVVATVNGKEKVLEENKDYKILSATRTKNLGKFSVQLEGIGNYTGSAANNVQIITADEIKANLAMDIIGTKDNIKVTFLLSRNVEKCGKAVESGYIYTKTGADISGIEYDSKLIDGVNIKKRFAEVHTNDGSVQFSVTDEGKSISIMGYVVYDTPAGKFAQYTPVKTVTYEQAVNETVTSGFRTQVYSVKDGNKVTFRNYRSADGEKMTILESGFIYSKTGADISNATIESGIDGVNIKRSFTDDPRLIATIQQSITDTGSGISIKGYIKYQTSNGIQYEYSDIINTTYAKASAGLLG